MLKSVGNSMRSLVLCQSRSIHSSSVLHEVLIKMPALSPTMTSGTIVRWMKKEGEEVVAGDVLCEIQTDKAVVAMEVDEEGTLAKILVSQDTPDLEIGRLIAVVAEPGEDWKSITLPSSSTSQLPPAVHLQEPPPPSAPTLPHSGGSIGHEAKIMGPAVKMLLALHGLKKGDVKPSGPHGVLLKGDILSHIGKREKPPPVPVQESSSSKESGPFVDLPMSNMRKTIAKRLTQSKRCIPHAYATAEISMGPVLRLRKELKGSGTLVSVNDFIIKASAYALRSVPGVNVELNGEEVREQGSCDISVAVATESGLITPIIHAADTLGLLEISERVRLLADRAKDNKLQPHEFIGGTFTVSNLGMYGISEFTAIINPPQAAILAVGGSFDSFSPDMKSEPKMRVTLCFDNRAISDDTAAEFLKAFSDGLCDPEKMLLGASPGMLYLGRDYPKGYDYYQKQLKAAFLKNKDETDPERIRIGITRGRYMIKEIEALYKLKKYRAMKQRYYDEQVVVKDYVD